MARKIRFQPLEPRILLDAAAGLTLLETSQDHQDRVFDDFQAQQASDDATEVSNTGLQLHETETNAIILGSVEETALVVVDTSIEGYEQLLADLSPSTEILLIDGDRDGLQQLVDYVSGRNDISSIHILSHGDEGEIRLGTALINSETLDQYADQFALIGDSLTEDGDLLLYGCAVAENGAGIDFVSKVAEYSDANVAASTDLTGDAAQGGDWDLEYAVGTIDGANLELTSFKGLLFDPQALSFSAPTLVTGDGTSIGSEWLFSNVGTTSGGDDVDAVITIIAYESTLGTGANDLPIISDMDGDTLADSWDPILQEPANGGTGEIYSATVQVDFFISGSSTPLIVDSFLSPRDIDGGTSGNSYAEGVAVTAPVVSVIVAGGTSAPPDGYEDPDGNMSPYDLTALATSVSYNNDETTISVATNPTVVNQGLDNDEAWAATFQVVQAETFVVEIEVDATAGGNPPTTRLFSFLFDEVTFSTPNTISIPIVDADADDSSGAINRNYNTGPYLNGSSPIDVVDSDVEITDTDPNTTTMNSATVTLTNPQSGDVLTVASLPAGITSTGSGSSLVQLSGVASIADYQAALQAITYSNGNSIIDGSDRLIHTQVDNGDTISPIAITTIDVFGTPTVDALNTSDTQPTITGTWDSTNGTDLSVNVNGITYTLSDPELTNVGDAWSLDLSGVQTLPFGTYDIGVTSTDGSNNVSDQTNNELRVLSSPEWAITGDSGVEEGQSASYTISLVGEEALSASDTVSVVVDLTDIDTTAGDFGDTLDNVLTTLAGSRSDLSYVSGTNTLTFTSSGGDAMADIVFAIPAASDGAESDEDYKLVISAPNNSDLSSSEFEVTTTITDQNDLPDITSLTADNSTFTEGDVSAASIFSGASVTAVEANQTIDELVFTVSGLQDGALEVVTIDGTAISLIDGNSGTTTANAYDFSVSVSSGTATVTVTTTGATIGEAETLVNGLSYQNNSADTPTAGNRVVTITSLTDSGSDNNVRTTGLPGASTIVVDDVNDAPVVTPPALSLVWGSNPLTVHGTGFTVDDVDFGTTGTATATLVVTQGTLTIAAGSSGITVDSGNGTQSVQVSGTVSEIDSLLRGDGTGTVEYTSTSTNNDTLTVTVDDGGNTGGAAEQGANSVTITKSVPSNNDPVISNLNSDVLNYAEGAPVTVIDQGTAAVITDADGGDFDGGRLIITPSGNITAEDRFSIDETGDITVTPSGLVQYLGTTIGNTFGTFSETSGGYITLNENATEAATTALLQAITYENIAGSNPTAGARTVDFSVEDGDGGVSTIATVTINVSVNADPPSIDLDANDSSGATGNNYNGIFDQGAGSAVSIVDTADVSVSDPEGNDVTVVTIVAGGINDGVDEQLIFGVTTITLNADANPMNISVGGVNVDVDYVNATQTIQVTANGGGNLTTAQVAAILADITYDNNSGSPTVSPDRTFSITATDTTAETSAAAISTIAINAAPVIDLDQNDSSGSSPSFTTTFAENGSAISLTDSDTSVVDANSDPVILTIAASNIVDGIEEVLSFSGTEFTLDTSNQAFGDISVGGVNVDVIYNGTTRTFTITDADGVSGITPSEAVAVLEAIAYHNDSDTPNTTSTRTFTITANDGTANSSAVTSSISVTATNDAPVINDISGRNLTYIVGSGTAVVDSVGVATVADPEENFDATPVQSNLTVSLSAGATTGDTLAIRNEGVGAGEIGISGANVTYGGTVIGTFSGGSLGSDLVVDFNSNADSAAIGALINNLTFDYSGSVTGSRMLDLTLLDDAGASSNIASISIGIGNDVIAADDNYSIDSDNSSISVNLPGVLDNDSNSAVPGATLNYDAATSGGSTSAWVDDTSYSGFDWALSGVTYNASPTTSLPGISSTYTFAGSGGGTMSDLTSIAGDPTNADATFEMWFRPSDLTGDEMLFESGGATDGIAIYLEGNQLLASVRDSGTIVNLSHTLTAGDITDFVQVVVAVDLTNDLVTLYVNGTQSGSAAAYTGNDWSGTNDAGLGTVNSSTGAQNNAAYADFDGEIAIFRFYESVFDVADVQENYNVIAAVGDGLTVTEVDGETDESNDVSGTYGSLNWAADGSIVYNLNTSNQDVIDLQLGSTLTDTFTYKVADSDSPANTDSATITITIDGTNDSPILDLDADDSSGAIDLDYFSPFVISVDTSVDIVDSDVSLTDVNDSTFPSFTVTVAGILDGSDETLTIGGVGFGLSTDVATTTVTVGAVNFDVTYTSGVMTVVKNGGGMMSAAEVTSVLLDAGYGNVNALPTLGDRTFDVVVSDGDDLSKTATSTISVVNNDLTPPVANNDSFSLDEGATLNLDLAGTGGGGQDTDVGSGLLLSSIVIQGSPTNGTINAINADGTVDYTHNGSETLSDSFTYTIKDKVGNESNVATVNITITPVNDAPVVSNLNGDALGYGLGSGAQIIDSGTAAIVTDDNANFDTGSLTVDYNGTGTAGENISINSVGDGSGEIRLTGTEVFYEGTKIGDVSSNGTGGIALVVDFNSSATQAAVSTLLQSITYENTGSLDFSTAIDFTIDDGGTGTSVSNVATVTIQNDIAAFDDADSTDEDTVVSKNTVLTGVLSNDANAPAAGVTLSFDAASDDGLNSTWENEGGVAGYDAALAGETFNSSVTTSIPGITSSYSFTGGGAGASGGTLSSLDGLPSSPSTSDASFELWAKPVDTALNRTEMLFESGGATDGIAVYLNNNILTVDVRDSGIVATATYTLSAGEVGDFFQILVTVDLGNDELRLAVNGAVVDTQAYTGNDWAGGDDAGLGRINSGSAVTSGTYDDFSGDIAIFRFFESALTSSEVTETYNTIALEDQGMTIVSVVDGDSSAVPISTTSTTNFTTDLGATFSIFDDGRYSYDPTAADDLQDLESGETATETFTYTIQDNLGNQASAQLVVTTTGIDDAPTLGASVVGSTFTEGDATATDLFDAVATDAVEPNQTIEELIFTVSNVTDGDTQGEDEVINVDGTAIQLSDGSSGTTAGNSYGYSVSLAGNTATVTLTTSGATTAATETLIDGMSYQNNSEDPTEADRDITFTSITDSGLSGGSDENNTTTGLPGSATVSVVAVDDAPEVTATALTPTFTEEDVAPVDLFTGVSVDAIEAAQTIEEVVLKVTNVTNGDTAGEDEVLNIDGTAIQLMDGNTGTTTGTLSYTYSVTLNASDTATITITTTGAATSDIETLVDGLSYIHNDADEPTEADREISLISITDSGSSTLPDENATTAPSANLPAAAVVSVVQVDDAPTVTATPLTPTFTEGDLGPVDLFDSPITVDAVEAAQTIEEIVVTITNVTDGDNPGEVEFLYVDGTAVRLDDLFTGPATVNGYTYTVALNGSDTATVTITTAGALVSEIETLVDGLGYLNADTDNPTEADRVISIASITDSGLTGGGNENNTTLPTIDLPGPATVTVDALNDAPIAVVPDSAATEGITLDLTGIGLTVADDDAGTNDVIATLSVAEGALSVTTGDSGVVVGGSPGSAVTLTGTVAEINALLSGSSTGAVDYDTIDLPSASAILTLSVDDQGNSGGPAEIGTETGTITITAVNDAPVVVVPDSAATEDIPLDLTAIGLTVSDDDADGSDVIATLSVGEGDLTVLAGDSGVVIGGSPGTSITLTGTIIELNNLLSGVSTGTVDYDALQAPSANTSLILSVDDQGNTGWSSRIWHGYRHDYNYCGER